MEYKKRIEFIDLAKGICILLVIMTHTDVNVDFPGTELLDKRGCEGWFFGNIIDNQGPLRPICLAIVIIMMKLKWNF